MALTVSTSSSASTSARIAGLAYAWSALLVMWAFWICFVVFLATPRWAAEHWPFPTVDGRVSEVPLLVAVVVDLLLIALFGLQHSVMARPWFKSTFMARMPPAFERCTFVHAANITLIAMIVLWQPIPHLVWVAPPPWRELLWTAFAAGWIILLLGAISFGIFDLLGIRQMHAWYRGEPPRPPRLETGLLYRWMQHPMYVGVLIAVWA